ncbi:MAG: hypothetical protein P4L50_28345 [Anaerolineaceae bacterium]|nr:hypothetical protein [Anaerolineaceae bacterium]
MGLSNFFRRLVKDSPPAPQPENFPEPAGPRPEPVHRKVLALLYNPPVDSAGGKSLIDLMRWNDPRRLISTYIDDLRDVSYGYANFELVDLQQVAHFPVKRDGFVYTGDDFMRRSRSHSGFHEPDAADYYRILDEFDVVSKINQGSIDEVWMFGSPYAGFYESQMAGPGAFFCNSEPLSGVKSARRFVIMGFNYERGVGEMLEDMGHRAESILRQVFHSTRGQANLWERFCLYDQVAPGRAEVGNVHFAPNSQRDYDWGNPSQVRSRCHTWYHFPDLSGEPVSVNCQEWGNGDIRLHHLWWLRHFPHLTGESAGIAYNWWQYVIDPNTVH